MNDACAAGGAPVPALQVQGLVHQYAGAPAPALRGVDLCVNRGEICGLLGPNGAGKTTLMTLIDAGARVQQGRIHAAGVVSLAPQRDAFYEFLSVRENLRCFAAACGLDGAPRDAAIERALEATALAAQAGKRAQRLSGGMRRRLNLAIAWLADPAVLLLDEPTAGVDPETRTLLLKALRGFANAGAAVLFSSHLMSDIEAVADRVVLLHEGRVLRDATLDALLHEASTRVEFDLCSSADTRRASAIGGTWGVVFVDGLRFSVALAQGRSATGLFAALDAAGVALQSARFGRATLDETFSALSTHAASAGPVAEGATP